MEQAVKRDNFDGIAYLTNYCQNFSVDASEWNLSQFHSAINYYLNVNFNMSKVMIFTKFYRHFYACRAQKILQGETNLSEKAQKTAAIAIFEKHEGLVDMRALFSFLIDHIGPEQVIDPLTKEDALWNLVDFFTQDKTFFNVSQHSANNSLNVEDMARYFGKQFAQKQTLDRVMKVALRLEGTAQSKQFEDALLREFKNYQARNFGAMPPSFDPKAVKNAYLKLRATNSLNPDGSELVLYLLKSLNLNQEVIDYCTLSADSANNNVKQYYMSEALMQMPLQAKKQYLSSLQQASVLPDDSADMTPCQLTQATKAVMLDKGGAAGYRYFHEKSDALRKENLARDDMLLSMYNSVFDNAHTTSLEDFKKTYLRSGLLAARIAKESFAVNQLSRIIRGKDYDEIENLFSLYQLIREESHLTKTRAPQDEINKVSERRRLLQHDMIKEDVRALEQIQQLMGEDKIEIVNASTREVIQHSANAFKSMTLEDAEYIRQRHKMLED